VLYDGLFTFVLRILNIAVSVALGVLTARLLGPAGKGIYAMPAVQAGLVATAFGGLSSTTSYFLLNRNSGRRIVVPALISASVLIAVAAVVVAILAVVARALWAAPAAVASLPASAAVAIVLGYVAGVKRIRYAPTTAVATTLVTFALMAVGLLLVARTPWVAIAAWILGSTTVAVVALAAMVLHARTLPAGEPVRFFDYFSMTVKVGAGSLVTLLNYRADMYIVAVFLPAFDLGLYTVAVAAAEGLLVPTQIAALVTSPHIGGLDREAASRLTARCVRNNLLVAGITCAVIFVMAPYLVELFYGQAFLPLVPALRILLIGVVALSLGSPLSSYYTLKLGKPEIALVLAGSSAALCIATALILVPHLGIEGAAIASTVAYIVGQAAAIVYFSQHASVPFNVILLPNRQDVRTYQDFARRVYRDALTFCGRPLRAEGK
jgi:O-antigen/teichoic acid export membrane protein